jgi:hypothetical protein
MGAETLMLFRGVERLAIVAAGVLLIYFGFRLFLALPTAHGSDGKLEMPSASVTVSRVGPGVFFAVFGTFLLWQMAEKVIRVDQAAPPVAVVESTAPPPRATVIFGSGAAAPPSPQALRHARNDLAALNCAERRLLPTLPPELRDDVTRAFRRARVAMLEPVWQPAWGGREVADVARLGNWPPGELAEIATAQHRDC